MIGVQSEMRAQQVHGAGNAAMPSSDRQKFPVVLYLYVVFITDTGTGLSNPPQATIPNIREHSACLSVQVLLQVVQSGLFLTSSHLPQIVYC